MRHTPWSIKHNMSKSREYFIYHDMKQRCYNARCKPFQNYGGRGIKVCSHWLKSFMNFYEDMGPRPTPKHSLDRINNNKGYSKSNCKWSTHFEQCNNFRSNVFIQFNKKRQTISQWAREVGMSSSTLQHRYVTLKWGAKKSLTLPVGWKPPKKIYIKKTQGDKSV